MICKRTAKMAALSQQPYFIFVLGPPGAGKGTLCSRFALEQCFYHLSVGDCLRDFCSKESALSEQVRQYLATETMLPNELIKQIFDDEILPMLRANKYPCVIVDGFPRSASQIPDWGPGVPALVLFFDCPKEIAAKRVIERGRGGASQETLAAIFQRRYAQHETENHKIVDHYAKMEASLPLSANHPYFLDAYDSDIDESMLVTIDTSKTPEESWNQIVGNMKKSLHWNNLIAEIHLQEKATTALAQGYDGDDEDDGEGKGEDGIDEDESKDKDRENESEEDEGDEYEYEEDEDVEEEYEEDEEDEEDEDLGEGNLEKNDDDDEDKTTEDDSAHLQEEAGRVE